MLQVWEASYREMLNVYMTNSDLKNLTDSAKCILSVTIQENRSTYNLVQHIEQLLEDSNFFMISFSILLNNKQMMHGNFGHNSYSVIATVTLVCTLLLEEATGIYACLA